MWEDENKYRKSYIRREMKTYYCFKCDIDFEGEDELRANRPTKCPKCKKGGNVVRSLNPLKQLR